MQQAAVIPYKYETQTEKEVEEGLSLKAKIGLGIFAAVGVTGLAVWAHHSIKKHNEKKSDAKSFDDGSPATMAKQIKMAFDNDGYWGTDTKALRDVLSRIKSKQELEKVRKEYEAQFHSPMYQDMMKELQSSEYREMLQIMEGKPEKPGVLTAKQLSAWAKRLKAAFDKTYGFLPGTDEAAVRAVLNEVPTQTAFIGVGRAYYNEYKKNLMDELRAELEPWELPEFLKIITSKPKA